MSDLEAALLIVGKLLSKRIKENPKSGYILNKGEENETRLRYSKVKSCIDSLCTKLSMDGCFSIGICKNCRRFNPKASTTGFLGSCNNTKIVHEYSTCDKFVENNT